MRFSIHSNYVCSQVLKYMRLSFILLFILVEKCVSKHGLKVLIDHVISALI